MADAPGAQQLLSQTRSDLQRLRDAKQQKQAELDAINAQIQGLQAIRDDCMSYIQFQAAKP